MTWAIVRDCLLLITTHPGRRADVFLWEGWLVHPQSLALSLSVSVLTGAYCLLDQQLF